MPSPRRRSSPRTSPLVTFDSGQGRHPRSDCHKGDSPCQCAIRTSAGRRMTSRARGHHAKRCRAPVSEDESSRTRQVRRQCRRSATAAGRRRRGDDRREACLGGWSTVGAVGRGNVFPWRCRIAVGFSRRRGARRVRGRASAGPTAWSPASASWCAVVVRVAAGCLAGGAVASWRLAVGRRGLSGGWRRLPLFCGGLGWSLIVGGVLRGRGLAGAVAVGTHDPGQSVCDHHDVGVASACRTSCSRHPLTTRLTFEGDARRLGVGLAIVLFFLEPLDF